MFFVHHDQAEFRQRCEHRQPRAEHDARRARLRGDPVIQPLGVVQAAVQADDFGIGKAPAHRGFELRRERNFRHQQQRLTAFFQHCVDGA